MKQLIIICEGQSEQEFCDKLLKPHLASYNIDIQYPLILHSGGGIVPWKYLKKQIELHNESTPDAFITTFIDYYGLTEQRFPDWARAHTITDLNIRMELLEMGMFTSLQTTVGSKFIPYIQLHEFEALMFSDFEVFKDYYEEAEYDAGRLKTLCASAPESINDGPQTAPSKRLESIIPRYHKNTDGPGLAQLAGLSKIRSRCPGFNRWLTKLEQI